MMELSLSGVSPGRGLMEPQSQGPAHLTQGWPGATGLDREPGSLLTPGHRPTAGHGEAQHHALKTAFALLKAVPLSQLARAVGVEQPCLLSQRRSDQPGPAEAKCRMGMWDCQQIPVFREPGWGGAGRRLRRPRGCMGDTGKEQLGTEWPWALRADWE